MAEGVTQTISNVNDKEQQIRELYHKKQKKLQKQTELAFKVLTSVVILGSTVCFLNFFTFRQYCNNKGIYVISPFSLIWAVVGYVFYWLSRKLFGKITKNWVKHYMHPRNAYCSPEVQQQKINNMTKQSYDVIFHTATTIVIFTLFRNESWFPMCSGGVGSCDAIFASYPNWPQTLNPAVQIFYLFQLGVNIYLLLELLIFKKRDFKSNGFYELVFHHCVTVFLIIFSVGYNFVPIGIMVMFVHDSSDAARAIGRVMSESKYSVQHLTLSKIVDYAYLVVWLYTRIIIFPLCLMDSMYHHIVDVSENLNFLYLQRYYLISLCLGIYFLQSFWIYFLARGSSNERKGNVQFIKWQAKQPKKESLGEEGKQLKKE